MGICAPVMEHRAVANGNRVILKIRWKEHDRIDRIPYEWLGKDGTLKRESHSTTGPHGGDPVDAICRVEVSGNQADLRYGGDHEPENRARDMFIGTMRVTFHDPSRDGIRAIEWLDENGDKVPAREFCLEIENSNQPKVPENGRPNVFLAQVRKFDRDPDVVKYALAQANGKCGDCKRPAPFRKAVTNDPYLEVHHITPLAQGGADTPDNVVALCPNCHRRRHYGNPEDR